MSKAKQQLQSKFVTSNMLTIEEMFVYLDHEFAAAATATDTEQFEEYIDKRFMICFGDKFTVIKNSPSVHSAISKALQAIIAESEEQHE